MRIKLVKRNARNDYEKAVLPAIIYVHKAHVTLFLIGWWHWAVGIAFIGEKLHPHD